MTPRLSAGEPRHSQKFFRAFFQKRTKENKDFFLKKEAKTFLCWARAGCKARVVPPPAARFAQLYSWDA